MNNRSTQRGATLVEYALLVALIAVVCIIAINFLNHSDNSVQPVRPGKATIHAPTTAR